MISEQARENKNAYNRRWYRENKEAQLERTNAWRDRNRDRVNALSRARRLGDKVLAARRRAQRALDVVGPAAERLRRTAGDAPFASRVELKALWESQGRRCALTGVLLPPGLKPHLDHKTPVAKGGHHTIDNLRWVHPMANRAKGAQSDEEFLAWWNAR